MHVKIWINEDSARVLYFQRPERREYWTVAQLDHNDHESEWFVRIFNGSEIADYMRQAVNENVANGSVNT